MAMISEPKCIYPTQYLDPKVGMINCYKTKLLKIVKTVNLHGFVQAYLVRIIGSTMRLVLLKVSLTPHPLLLADFLLNNVLGEFNRFIGKC